MFVKNKNIHSYISLKALLLPISCLILLLYFSFNGYASQLFGFSTTLFQQNETYTYQTSNPLDGLIVTGYVKDEKVEELNDQHENEDFHAIDITKLHKDTRFLSDKLHKISYYNFSTSYKNQVGTPLFLLHHSWQGYLS